MMDRIDPRGIPQFLAADRTRHSIGFLALQRMAMSPSLLRTIRPIAIFASLASGAVLGAPLLAQSAQFTVPSRLVRPIDDNSRITLHGYVHPLANAANDRGAAPDSMPLERMHLVLKRSDAQETELKQYIAGQHTPGSASYHKWLTPDQFGKQFGPSDQDVATVESWLSAQGFDVVGLKPGRQVIEFTGSVAQLRTAFHTQIRQYEANGNLHFAAANEPQIPAALSPVVGGFVSLNNFRPQSHARMLGRAFYDPKTGTAKPDWTVNGGEGYPTIGGVNFAVTPGDFGVQYDLPNASLNPAYSGTTYDGTGQTIAIINEANINIALVNQFRTLFGLPANPPNIVIDGNDPGIDGINNPDGPNYATSEAYLDVEWAGAVAPKATVDLVIAADTALENGLYLAAEHAIYSNLAPVVSVSFGACESAIGSTNAFLLALTEQAAAEGITVTVSTGDNGSAGCDNPNAVQYASYGAAVSGFASTPYDVAVGGTDFYYSNYQHLALTDLSTYWNTTGSNTPSVTLKTPIPEQPWNNSQFGLDASNYYSTYQATTIGAGSGGASSAAVCAAGYNQTTGVCLGTPTGYPKPSWQMGTGVPADNVRDIPDVSLFAADGPNYAYYATCVSDGDCQPNSSGPVQIFGVGGTSASAPAFAGIMALVNQKYGRQGQADFVLYPLKAQFPAAFHDVTVGSISVPCKIGTVNCISVASPITIGGVSEGQIGSGTTPYYNASAGYNLATGLGSVDATVLLNNWGNISFTGSTTTLTPSSTSFAHGTAITISGSVTGTGSPTGNVALLADTTLPVQQAQATFSLSAGAFSASNVNYLPGGTYNIWGQYGGDGKNAASTSAKTQITVTPEASTTTFDVLNSASTSSASVITAGQSVSYGTQLILAAQVHGT
ncbi:MAG TPA: protease pro-enzyme activation domain-containing protein, partial [Acidobacteriaceae bacterium]|nr:protease pro-enzyme activation domain-containing protein [Acidobacteriaceae bacterium]